MKSSLIANKVKILGDIMLDKWISGNNEVESPEAPICIFKKNNERVNLGGAGNLAMNLKSLNIRFKIYADIAKDKNGQIISNLLHQFKIPNTIKKNKKLTTVKTRFLDNSNNHKFRLDEEKFFYNKDLHEKFLKSLKKNEIVIISDYAKGVVNKDIIKKIKKRNCLIFVDPKNSPDFYKDVFLIKPNMKKFEEWYGKFSIKKAKKVIKEMGWEWLIVTDGENGVFVFNKKQEYVHHKVHKALNPDVTGAGDIFFSIIIYSYIKKIDIFTAAEMASYTCAKLVDKKGIRLVKINHLKKNTIFTNGVFDTFHKGHLYLLRFSKKLGKKLIVGINSDKSVKINKGKDRPYNNLEKRISDIKKTGLVDKILVFNDKTPIKIIKSIKPDVIIKGGDYKFHDVVGKNVSNIILLQRIKKFSTSKIIKKIFKK